jgi:hypothetical protein
VRGTAVSTVSQDQKAIVLTQEEFPGVTPIPEPVDDDEARSGDDVSAAQKNAAAKNTARMASAKPSFANVAGVLDGYKITSFSSSRAIINGPGGSRLVFDNEEVVLGGVPWLVLIQPNGIEFMHEGQRVLLLFDRSLSSINRVNASSGDSNNNSSSGGGNTGSGNADSDG